MAAFQAVYPGSTPGTRILAKWPPYPHRSTAAVLLLSSPHYLQQQRLFSHHHICVNEKECAPTQARMQHLHLSTLLSMRCLPSHLQPPFNRVRECRLSEDREPVEAVDPGSIPGTRILAKWPPYPHRSTAAVLLLSSPHYLQQQRLFSHHHICVNEKECAPTQARMQHLHLSTLLSMRCLPSHLQPPFNRVRECRLSEDREPVEVQ
ncbi:hypothetical protein Aperf_G00000126636 [Anoplocephala perfoliata]